MAEPSQREIEAVTDAIIDVILDAGASIDFEVQPVALAAIAALDKVRNGE